MSQMYQVSTLQALMLGYTKGVINVDELLLKGNIGLGTFQDVNGEMIVLDHKIYKADDSGNVTEAPTDEGVPFGAVAFMENPIECNVEGGSSMEELKQQLNVRIDEDFGLNSMYIVRLDGFFKSVKARSEIGLRSHHVELSKILQTTQKDFLFENLYGTLVCLYFPDYMDGINAAGWHLHFVSRDKTLGGHVYDVEYDELTMKRCRLNNIQIQLPNDIAFDTYELKSVSNDEVKKVEQ